MRGNASSRRRYTRFPGLQGQTAYEMKPRINNILFYIKVALVELGGIPNGGLLLISVHPNN